jgi:curved DNA-binding protein CbpA
LENWEREWIDYYRLLGVYPDADVETVTAVYRRLARKYGVPGGSEPDEAKFRLLNEAKDILTEPAKREPYDVEYLRRERVDAEAKRNDGGRYEETPRSDDPSPDEGRGSSAPDSETGEGNSRHGQPATDFQTTGGSSAKAKSDIPEDARAHARRQFQIAVDYDRPLRQVIKLGDFDSPFLEDDSQALASYRARRSGRTTLTVELYAASGNYASVLGEIDDQGYRSLDALELLWFAAAFPAEQFKANIRAYDLPLTSQNYGLSATEIGTYQGSGRYCQPVPLSQSWIDEDTIRVAITPLTAGRLRS